MFWDEAGGIPWDSGVSDPYLDSSWYTDPGSMNFTGPMIWENQPITAYGNMYDEPYESTYEMSQPQYGNPYFQESGDTWNPQAEQQLQQLMAQSGGMGGYGGGLSGILGGLSSLLGGRGGAGGGAGALGGLGGLLQALTGMAGLGTGIASMFPGASTPGPSNQSGVYQDQSNNTQSQTRSMTPWFDPIMGSLNTQINNAGNLTPMAQGNTQASAATQALGRGEMPQIDPRMVDMLSAAYSRAAGDIAENSIEDARRRGFAGGLDLLGGAASPMYARQMSTLQEGLQQAIPQMALQLPQMAANIQHVNTGTNLMPAQSLMSALGPASQLTSINNSQIQNQMGSKYAEGQQGTPALADRIGGGLDLMSNISRLGTPPPQTPQR